MIAAGDALVVVGLSARALAAGAVRAGLRPIAVDFFADDDTAAVALHAERYPGGWRCGFQRRLLLPAIERAVAAAGVAPAGIVLGAGFEDRPRLIAALADRWPLFGSAPEAVRAVKTPERFAAACADLGIPHPPITRTVPETGDFVLKRRAGTGGAHVRPAPPGPVPAGMIGQRRVAGEALAAAVLSSGRDATVIGWTAQWAAPTADAPFRFAGVGGPVEPPAAFADAMSRAAVADAMSRAAVALVLAFGLVGLVSVDMLVGADSWWVLEVNPRPGGSFDVLDAGTPPLLAAHLAAVGGRLLAVDLARATIRVTEVVHAAADSVVGAGVIWPDWVHDRPPAGTRLAVGDPIATVSATGPDLDGARASARRRAAALAELVRDRGHHG